MARTALFRSFAPLAICFCALVVQAQSDTGATTPEPEVGLNIEGIMNTSDSLAWSRSDSVGEVVQVEVKTRGLMGLLASTPLGKSGVGRWFIAGGEWMWWILLSAIIGFTVLLERAWTMAKARTNTRRLIGTVITTLRSDGVTAAAQVCERNRGPIAAILHAGLLRADRGPEAVEKAIGTSGTIEMAFLERGLVALASVAMVAPLLGFLGTVAGMISAFEAIAAAEQVNAKVVASGISEALITTAFGLIVAIPAQLGHSFYLGVIDRFIIEMEETSAELVEELTHVSGK
jgi:biopolymer transport protein ExbB